MEYLPTPSGSFRLFRALGVTVYLHWSWLIVALIEYQRQGQFSSPIWNVLEYFTLFVIVLLHEYGHALACRSVGGVANQIVLWPLGGVAYVQPPPRPGAFLWSIAAGPLVNVLLVPITFILWSPSQAELSALLEGGMVKDAADTMLLARAVFVINLSLLIFNVLPIYPLDGGQILQSLLWFVTSRGTSVVVASVIGIVGGVGLAGLGLMGRWWLLAVIGGFIVLQAWSGLKYGLALRRRERLPRHMHLACPKCGAAPYVGPHWQCGECSADFDLFENAGVCPNCNSRFSQALCTECHTMQPIAGWYEVNGHGRNSSG